MVLEFWVKHIRTVRSSFNIFYSRSFASATSLILFQNLEFFLFPLYNFLCVEYYVIQGILEKLVLHPHITQLGIIWGMTGSKHIILIAGYGQYCGNGKGWRQCGEQMAGYSYQFLENLHVCEPL